MGRNELRAYVVPDVHAAHGAAIRPAPIHDGIRVFPPSDPDRLSRYHDA
jgi:hypothetical protein